MRELGLSATSAGAIRIVRRHATQLGLDASHFRGRRTWSDADLRNAVVTSRSWDEVLATLGLSTASGTRVFDLTLGGSRNALRRRVVSESLVQLKKVLTEIDT